MINKTPSNSDQFPVPVVGQLIPRGWFPRLVAFMNSLVLHGDNQYLAVRHDMNGTTISPTKKLIDALNHSGTPPSAGGGGGGGGSTSFPGIYQVSHTTNLLTRDIWYQANSDGLLYIWMYLTTVEQDYFYYYAYISTLDQGSYKTEGIELAYAIQSIRANGGGISQIIPIHSGQKFMIRAENSSGISQPTWGNISGIFYGQFTTTTGPF